MMVYNATLFKKRPMNDVNEARATKIAATTKLRRVAFRGKLNLGFMSANSTGNALSKKNAKTYRVMTRRIPVAPHRSPTSHPTVHEDEEQRVMDQHGDEERDPRRCYEGQRPTATEA